MFENFVTIEHDFLVLYCRFVTSLVVQLSFYRENLQYFEFFKILQELLPTNIRYSEIFPWVLVSFSLLNNSFLLLSNLFTSHNQPVPPHKTASSTFYNKTQKYAEAQAIQLIKAKTAGFLLDVKHMCFTLYLRDIQGIHTHANWRTVARAVHRTPHTGPTIGPLYEVVLVNTYL